jgi:hypothetical protein
MVAFILSGVICILAAALVLRIGKQPAAKVALEPAG